LTGKPKSIAVEKCHLFLGQLQQKLFIIVTVPTPITYHRRVGGRWRPNVMAVISDAFHLKQRVTELFGIVQSKFIGPRAF
jgi:hypothetical protein